MFFFPAKRDPAVYFCELPSSLAPLLHFLHSTQKLSQRKYYHDPSLLESFCDSPGCMKSKVRAGCKACLGPRICSYSNLQDCLHTHMWTRIHTHVVFKPHELLSFLKMSSFHILPYLTTFSSCFLVDIVNTNPNFETLLKYLFLCKNGSFPPQSQPVRDISLYMHACMFCHVWLFATPWTVLCPWDFPGKNTGVGWYFLLQGISPTQGLKPVHLLRLLHWQADSLPWSHLRNPNFLYSLPVIMQCWCIVWLCPQRYCLKASFGSYLFYYIAS